MLAIPKTLIQKEQIIRATEPFAQSIEYHADNWRRHLPQLQELDYICQRSPDKITRGDLLRLAASAKKSGQIEDIKRLFIGTMVWGYGTTGYGPWRTARMVASPGYPLILLKTFNLIVDGELHQAYDTFSLNRCGPSFFTKYFYFVGKGVSLKKYPLILDNRVYKALKDTGVEVSQIAKSSSWTCDGYLNYVRTIHEWAEKLNCEADQIEMFLFQMEGWTR